MVFQTFWHSQNIQILIVATNTLFSQFRPRRHRRPDHPDDLLGWFADTIKRTKNVIGFHGVISTLLPDPENPAVDQAIQILIMAFMRIHHKFPEIEDKKLTKNTLYPI